MYPNPVNNVALTFTEFFRSGWWKVFRRASWRTVEARLVLSGRIFRPLITAINELRLAFFRRLGRLARMKFAAYCYGWRFTYRTNHKRGAVV
jgi:hypothetical protein